MDLGIGGRGIGGGDFLLECIHPTADAASLLYACAPGVRGHAVNTTHRIRLSELSCRDFSTFFISLEAVDAPR